MSNGSFEFPVPDRREITMAVVGFAAALGTVEQDHQLVLDRLQALQEPP